MIILGIETSCDETSAAVVENGKKIYSNIVASQQDLHSRFGGVVPEIACRAHTDTIITVIDKAVAEANIKMSDLDAISVANTPGLIGALLIGLTAAKSLSWILKKPLITVNHLHAHIYASKIEYDDIDYPAISLVVSGGHTSLFLTHSEINFESVGVTIDDAAGEAFDKVGKILGLGYPAGPEIDTLSAKGNERAIQFPRSYLKKGSLDFSFSGIKTAVLYHCMGQDLSKASEMPKLTNQEIADIAASFQEAVIDVLVDKTIFAATKFSTKSIILGGGVACNSRLRQKLTDSAKRRGIPLFYPSKKLCMDNAAMVAGLAFHKYVEKNFSNLEVEAIP
ncbi:metal-dependent proteases with possible chaperone activity [Candidatus Scalindua japonica]|uniref:tRNA N6-adenosine threonylcarbamoyltransferase n=1 Tax=Candidatus Scalindua japonica TaxID=1284222 RepID=A0A286U0T8_9BACT|nr:tRNA (adenosine(37)-N6)-threonylcarbamoyltransferase complex transferase subunit TsaD [Candidatus Scalindua japonica]GAX61763.1 metal-dependent proteases with possible chaperone activity [Candidatus Scalindua japonica]